MIFKLATSGGGDMSRDFLTVRIKALLLPRSSSQDPASVPTQISAPLQLLSSAEPKAGREELDGKAQKQPYKRKAESKYLVKVE